MILETSVSSSFMRYGSLSSRGGGTAADPRLIFPLHRGSTAQTAWALRPGRAGPPWWGRRLIDRTAAAHRRAVERDLPNPATMPSHSLTQGGCRTDKSGQNGLM